MKKIASFVVFGVCGIVLAILNLKPIDRLAPFVFPVLACAAFFSLLAASGKALLIAGIAPDKRNWLKLTFELLSFIVSFLALVGLGIRVFADPERRFVESRALSNYEAAQRQVNLDFLTRICYLQRKAGLEKRPADERSEFACP